MPTIQSQNDTTHRLYCLGHYYMCVSLVSEVRVGIRLYIILGLFGWVKLGHGEGRRHRLFLC